MPSPPISISALTAARYQLETAASLFFTSSDPVSVHTLACAALEIIDDLARREPAVPPSFQDQFIARIKPEYQDQVTKKIRAPQNFFKHGGRMQKPHVEIRRGETDWLMFDAARLYRWLAPDLPDSAAVFLMWFWIQHPTIMADRAFKHALQAAQADFGETEPRTFFERFMRQHENTTRLRNIIRQRPAKSE